MTLVSSNLMRFPLLIAALLLGGLSKLLAAADSPTADFAERKALPQSPIPESDWYREKWRGSWGPPATIFPAPTPPFGADDAVWKQTRVMTAARDLIGLPYQHHHVPAWTPPATWESKKGGPESAGLDCSNFTAWVYNFALGIKFTGDVNEQADGPKAPGRRLAPDEPYEPGDLLFILQQDRTRVSHVVLYVDAGHILDEHGSGVAIRPFTGWYRTHLSHARRVIP